MSASISLPFLHLSLSLIFLQSSEMIHGRWPEWWSQINWKSLMRSWENKWGNWSSLHRKVRMRSHTSLYTRNIHFCVWGALCHWIVQQLAHNIETYRGMYDPCTIFCSSAPFSLCHAPFFGSVCLPWLFWRELSSFSCVCRKCFCMRVLRKFIHVHKCQSYQGWCVLSFLRYH